MEQETPGSGPRIRGYGPGYVVVGEETYESGVLLTPGRVRAGWGPADIGALTPEHLAPLLDAGVEVVVLGTGAEQVFPPTAVIAPLFAAGLGVEVMATDAACRSYNILLGDDRRVAAALILI